LDVQEVNFNPNLGSPHVDEVIDGVVITRVQVDGGFSVNLKSAKTMEELGLT